MPIIGRNGKPLTQREVNALIATMQGSYDTHIVAVNETLDVWPNTGSQLGQDLLKAYKKRREELAKDYLKKARGKKEVKAEDLLEFEIYSVNKEVLKKYDLNGALGYHDEQFAKNYFKDARNDTAYIEATGGEVEPQDTREGYNISAGSFHLADTPMAGVEELTNYNPNSDRIRGLYEKREGNSGTLYFEAKDAKKKGTEKRESAFKFDSSMELARIKSSELMNRMDKRDVTFADLYDTFTSLNEFVRMGDPGGGKMRADLVGVRGRYEELVGVDPAMVPVTVYKTLSTVADYMNTIKKTQDPALRKTQAIQLAAFTYQMTLSEHLFRDGNGRSCRLLADTILQTFGVPPHIPTKEEMTIARTIGKELDFEKGAELFFDGVKASSDILKVEKQKEQELREAQRKEEEARKKEQSEKEQPAEEQPAEERSLRDKLTDPEEFAKLKKQIENAAKEIKSTDEWFVSSNSGSFNKMRNSLYALNKAMAQAGKQPEVNEETAAQLAEMFSDLEGKATTYAKEKNANIKANVTKGKNPSLRAIHRLSAAVSIKNICRGEEPVKSWPNKSAESLNIVISDIGERVDRIENDKSIARKENHSLEEMKEVLKQATAYLDRNPKFKKVAQQGRDTLKRTETKAFEEKYQQRENSLNGLKEEKVNTMS